MIQTRIFYYLSGWFPSILASKRGIIESILLIPLQFYETLAVYPVSFFRRHFPLVGGALVITMTLHGMGLRYLIDVLNMFVDNFLYSRDPAKNYTAFWTGIRDRYASFHEKNIDWDLVKKIYGDKMNSRVSQNDLWTSLADSILLFDDPSIMVSTTTTRVRSRNIVTDLSLYKKAAIEIIRSEYLMERGGRIANNFVFGILKTEITTGRVGYIAITAMEGFVEVPIIEQTKGKVKIVVPEQYDLEAMRWAIEAILGSLGQLDNLILDVRLNQGGGSHLAALSLASYFTRQENTVAFKAKNRLPGEWDRFSSWKKYIIPYNSHRYQYMGPLILLQSQFTAGTAEMFTLSLFERPNTTRIGKPSIGSISQIAQFTLPNGWKVQVPYQRYTTAHGEQFEGSGIPVHVEIDTAIHNKCVAPDPCLTAAIDHHISLFKIRT